MNEIFVARNAFAATLTSCAVAKSVTTSGTPVVDERRVDLAHASCSPRSPTRRRTRAGPDAACPRSPSPRAGTPGSRRARRPAPAGALLVEVRARCRSAVPTGTVDLPDDDRLAAQKRRECRRRRRRHSVRSAAYSPFFCGVPTQRKCTSPSAATSSYDVVKRSRPAARFLRSSSSSPGSKNGHLAGGESRDLGRVDVEAEDVVAEFGHADGVGRAEVAGADDGQARRL